MTTRTEPTPQIYVAADGRTIASRGPLDVYEKYAFAESTEKADRIVRAVNSHAALVEALEEVLPLLSQINLSSEGMRGEATERAESIARAALAAAKGTP